MEVIEKKIRVKYADAIRLQIKMYCFMNKLSLSENEINCLVYLSAFSDYVLNDFCKKAADVGIFKSTQTVRNFISKAVENGFVDKFGERNRIKISDKLELCRNSEMLLKYNILYVAEK